MSALEGDAIELDPLGRFVTLSVRWPSWQHKAAYLQSGAAKDAQHHLVDTAARRIVAAAGATTRLDEARALHAFVRDEVRYTSDPRRDGQPRERLACAPWVLLHPSEDCDGKARLFVALCLARGIPARIRPIAPLGAFTHVQAVVAPDGRWLLAELILDGVQLGQGIEAGRVGPDGKLVLR